ncbi:MULTISPECIES: hypothetical protein [unclassified Saccharothrix]|uniref:hypothetical protein n=1 Tax=unclassified Saccharothrix TaxID=2593673 RepID=UPI00307D6376
MSGLAEFALLRANPAYELVEYSRLDVGERAGLDGLLRDSSFFGVLRPISGTGSVKAVCQNTALLWYALREPGPPPDYLSRAGVGDDMLRGLVRDGVLQCWDGTSWRDGPTPLKDQGNLDSLAQGALAHGAMMVRCGERDPLTLSLRLYAHHHEPLTPRRRRALATPEDVLRYCGLDNTPAGWERSAPGPTDPWIRWRPARRGGRSRCKAYVSPDVASLPAVLPAAVRLADRLDAAGCKLGGTPSGVSRPDRFVCYFADLDAVEEFADALRVEVDGVRGRGVPLTAPLGPDNLVSWGTDPDPARVPVPWLGGSWRRQITDVLATALAHAGPDHTVTELVAIARAGATEHGIDPMTWTPADARR